MKKIIVVFFSIMLASVISIFSASWAIPAAYQQRGYMAYGGEWIFVIVVFVISFYVSEKAIFWGIKKRKPKSLRWKGKLNDAKKHYKKEKSPQTNL